MKDLSEFNIWLDEFVSNCETECMLAMEKTINQQKEIVDQTIEIPHEARNTNQFIQYSKSFNKTIQMNNNIITGELSSDLVVGGDDPKWKDVPVGAFLEWGTGELGFHTNTYPHGYDYTLEVWDRHTWLQRLQTGSFGIRARPHLIPSFNKIKPIFKNNIREAVEKAWTKSGK